MTRLRLALALTILSILPVAQAAPVCADTVTAHRSTFQTQTGERVVVRTSGAIDSDTVVLFLNGRSILTGMEVARS